MHQYIVYTRSEKFDTNETRKRILVIDDEPDITLALKIVLEIMDMQSMHSTILFWH
jgi:hypothetical protein